MDLKDYQTQALGTAVYRTPQQKLICTILGLVGESGEVADKVKKIIRDRETGVQGIPVLTPEDKENLKKELGDVLWYLAVLSDSLGYSLEDVAQTNLDKLRSRFERGVIQGSGDHR